MKYDQKEYEDIIKGSGPVLDFKDADLRRITDLAPDSLLDNQSIEEITFENARLPKYFIKKIVSQRGAYDEVFADMFGGKDLEVDFTGADFSSAQLNTPLARGNFYHAGFIIKRAKFMWDNGKIDPVEHRAWRSDAQRKDLEEKVDALLEESAINEGNDSKIERIAVDLSELFETHPFIAEKYYFTYDEREGLKDLSAALEAYKSKAYKTLASDYSLGRKIKRFFKGKRASQVRVASQMLNELKSEIRDLKRDLED
jgi:hypothetical protein